MTEITYTQRHKASEILKKIKWGQRKVVAAEIGLPESYISMARGMHKRKDCELSYFCPESAIRKILEWANNKGLVA